MEQNTFTEKLQIPSFNNENKNLENKSSLHKYKWIILFIALIILFLLFINGMSIYNNNLFIN